MKSPYILPVLVLSSLLLSGCVSNTVVPTTPAVSPSGQPPTVQDKVNDKDMILNLDNRGLTSVPANTFDDINIQVLDLSHNKLTGSLPGEIRHLSHLTFLDMSYNSMTGIPAEIGQLTELETLNLSHNQFTGLPHELGNLTHLRTLDISGNNYATADLAIIEKQLPSSVTIIK
ncbi:MAG: hypothetical protein CO029_00555 [Candidatus Magasanikbacteria bacterium CG_4_9_14_0_2_um_filter_41_10]|uniref:Disease resistance R13L4/SHOC-2-like LRR domain-containing protein n=1 Tax=Candidatus Magasanikbacteria bacterium CG_4_10_14_0_2_um_filter_41_31 TaxID=1974639 RepID=A0A2M7V5Z1_9BACT|nr:MAG: hypothetical protein AUJ37_04730 [Candidatus Magasanikbacteria bacterium CG1_02_41_34]PIZ94029.1 MAG: hypothetical protein COX83_00360 [Candidatus Magasanikbacteria bacterium CG_4_10_14_0_2_um_filter_41_31]PJC53859.1 MAG: hypothetical protein CO029_00555 [Candidatus Magasanikbacteria bacterium CG_4_9_14_0_2_um_filter_41_10]